MWQSHFSKIQNNVIDAKMSNQQQYGSSLSLCVLHCVVFLFHSALLRWNTEINHALQFLLYWYTYEWKALTSSTSNLPSIAVLFSVFYNASWFAVLIWFDSNFIKHGGHVSQRIDFQWAVQINTNEAKAYIIKKPYIQHYLTNKLKRC